MWTAARLRPGLTIAQLLCHPAPLRPGRRHAMLTWTAPTSEPGRTALLHWLTQGKNIVNADSFTIDQDAVSSLEETLHQLLCHASTSVLTSAMEVITQGPVARMRHWNTRTQGLLKSSHQLTQSLYQVPRWPTHRRHKGYTIVGKPFAVSGTCAPRSTATLSDDGGEHNSGEAMPNELVMSDDSEDSVDQALPTSAKVVTALCTSFR